jgi:hypothetical protein
MKLQDIKDFNEYNCIIARSVAELDMRLMKIEHHIGLPIPDALVVDEKEERKERKFGWTVH